MRYVVIMQNADDSGVWSSDESIKDAAEESIKILLLKRSGVVRGTC